jgi:hypothetical protein
MKSTFFPFLKQNCRSKFSIRFLLVIIAISISAGSYAQDDPSPPYVDTSTVAPEDKKFDESDTYRNEIAGEFTPSKGFNLVKTNYGSLNISGYLLARYINQLPEEETFTDHLGRVTVLDPRNDINIHRVMVWLTGFLGDPKFRYNLTIWGLATTNQVLIFGNLTYFVDKALKLGVGIGPNLGCRALQGTWPYFNASDRQLSEESLRPGFSGSFWITGEILPRFYYTANVANNLSQLGTTAANLTRDLATSASLLWMPTTGEFGERGGNLDFENHKNLATRFGVSYVHARDDRLAPVSEAAAKNTQIKISDGLNFYDTGTLGDGITVKKANYDQGSVDLGFKIKGFHMQLDYFFRYLSKFEIDGPDPGITDLFDHGGQISLSHMLVHKTLGAYVSSTYLFDQFQRNPWEVVVGLNYYPIKSRSWRLNGQMIYVDRSSADSNFGYYLKGLKGPILSLGTDILF